MPHISTFLDGYKRQQDFYEKLSEIVGKKLEQALKVQGIKAIVTHRAKKLDSLKEKIEKRNSKKKYQSVKEIEDDIVDLAGIRVALYFPSDREVVDSIINELFDIKQKKVFPDSNQKPNLKKRFSGYWANHYRGILKKEESNKRFWDSLFEIQVASVLMHAWSEVEHDLLYKPMNGEPSEDEVQILDEINGLVIAGEIALERLQKIIADKVKSANVAKDAYELKTFIGENLKYKMPSGLKMGNLEFIHNIDVKPIEFISSIDNIDSKKSESVAGNIFDYFIENKINTVKDIDNFVTSASEYVNEKKNSSFESFIRAWIIFEKAIKQIDIVYNKKGKGTQRPLPISDEVLNQVQKLTIDEKNRIRQLRKIRNYLIHGIEVPSNVELKKYLSELKPIVSKLVDNIENAKIKNYLSQEIQRI